MAGSWPRSALRAAWTCALFMCLMTPGVAEEEFDPEARLRQMGLQLPAPSKPIANYVGSVRSGNLVFLSGHGPCTLGDEGKGKVGRERTLEEANAAARATALCLLGTLKAEIGDLARVRRIVRVFGMVNAVDDFDQQPQVVNGCSDLLVAAFGDRGRHARAAVGVASLPRNWSVEIEMLVEIDDRP